jgi:hypothetical protein
VEKQPDLGESTVEAFLQELSSKLAAVSSSDHELTKILVDHIIQLAPEMHCVATARNAIKGLAETRAKTSSVEV